MVGTDHGLKSSSFVMSMGTHTRPGNGGMENGKQQQQGTLRKRGTRREERLRLHTSLRVNTKWRFQQVILHL